MRRRHFLGSLAALVVVPLVPLPVPAPAPLLGVDLALGESYTGLTLRESLKILHDASRRRVVTNVRYHIDGELVGTTTF
jgi:hypothetical protein